MPSSTACTVARPAPSSADALSRQRSTGCSASSTHEGSAGDQDLNGEPGATGAGAIASGVARFYTTVRRDREHVDVDRHGSTSNKEHRTQMVRRRADSELVRRRLPGQLVDWAWSRTRGAMSRGGMIGPPRDTAPPPPHTEVWQETTGARYSVKKGPPTRLSLSPPLGAAARSGRAARVVARTRSTSDDNRRPLDSTTRARPTIAMASARKPLAPDLSELPGDPRRGGG